MGGKVTICCKMPHGIVLRLHKETEGTEPVLGGGTRAVKVWEEDHARGRVVVAGVAVPFGQAANVPIAGGYALTHNVDEDWWAEWLRQNRDSDMVRNRLIFAQKSQARARDQAKDQKDVRSGLEPLNPEMREKGGRMVPVDPRFPRVSNKNLSEVQPDTERA